jgi:hypothetical protein
MPDGDQEEQLTEAFQGVGKIANGALISDYFHRKSHELFLVCSPAPGAMNIKAGDDYQPLHFQTVPITEIALDEGPDGDIGGVNSKRCYRYGSSKDALAAHRLAKSMVAALPI